MGRDYQAVEYQSFLSVTSPTRDPKLRVEVRAIWGSKESARKLLDSLLIDYSTEDIHNGDTFTGWEKGSALQAEAALRLLYYFPKESAPLIAARLRTFDVEDAGDDRKRYTRREVRNGVRTSEFIAAVAWSKDPAIRDALSTIAKRTEDHYILKPSIPRGHRRVTKKFMELNARVRA